MDMKRSQADPCLYFNWTDKGLVLLVSWINDNLIIGNDKIPTITKKELMNRFDCEDCGEIEEYAGCKITRIGKHAFKFR